MSSMSLLSSVGASSGSATTVPTNAAPLAPPYLTTIFCLFFPFLGFVFSAIYTMHTRAIKLDGSGSDNENAALVVNQKDNGQLLKVYTAIYDGAHSFLWAEYRFIALFMMVFSLVILLVLGFGGGSNSTSWINAAFTVLSFLVGGSTSVLSGYIGMKIGVYANARTAVKSAESLEAGFITAFKAAVVMGFCLVSFGILNAFILISILRLYYKNAMVEGAPNAANETRYLFEAVAGFGLGGSSMALFGRVGGGIYTKAADVGADLVGKVEAGIPEDDPRNPAVIADNVGDNVGDIAGMGADLFGSFAEATCAALVIASQTAPGFGSTTHVSSVWHHWSVISFPLIVSCVGLFASFVTTFYCTHMQPPTQVDMIEPTLKRGLLISTIVATPLMYMAAAIWLPVNIGYIGGNPNVKNWEVFICGACGLWSGLIIGYITEYYTSNAYQPVQELADSCRTGSATNVIFGLALGYKSVIIPAMALALSVYIAITLAGFYGIAIAALGILSTLSFGLTIDAFGPISDNAGGVAEMCEMGEEVRERTDALDAAGNTTAAIGKGFAIGSAAFVSLALFSGFVTITKNRPGNQLQAVNILTAFPFAGLLIGAMLPYWFTAMTMKSVGKAALEMVNEVRSQFQNNPGILQGTVEPDYDSCIRISTEASLYEMMWPGILVMFTPLVVGFFFGTQMLAGVLAGALVSGVQMAISQSNTGGAWDNAKKYVEKGGLGEQNGKGSDAHKAAVVGDTVGDPLKDTSGPSLNILIKLMAIISLVFARSFPVTVGGLAGMIAQAARK